MKMNGQISYSRKDYEEKKLIQVHLISGSFLSELYSFR